MQRLMQNVTRATLAAAAARADAELLTQFSQTAATFGDRRADIAVGDGMTNADVHGEPLFGQNQLALAGFTQAVRFAVMEDDHFLTSGEENAAVDAAVAPACGEPVGKLAADQVGRAGTGIITGLESRVWLHHTTPSIDNDSHLTWESFAIERFLDEA
jgi:hypothetical protein